MIVLTFVLVGVRKVGRRVVIQGFLTQPVYNHGKVNLYPKEWLLLPEIYQKVAKAPKDRGENSSYQWESPSD